MEYILDLTIILIFIVCVGYAYKRGFMKASYTILSLIATFALVFCLKTPFEDFISKSSIGEAVRENITQKAGTDSAAKPEDIAASMGLPKFLAGGVSAQIGAAQDDADAATNAVSTAVISLISIVLLFLAVRITVFLLLKILDVIFRLPVLNFVNKTAGLLIGVLNALIIIYVAVAVLSFFGTDKLVAVHEAMDKTFLCKYFYENNLLMRLFMK